MLALEADAIVAYVQEHDWVSFAELTQQIGDGARGDMVLESEYPNVLYWMGMSEAFTKLMIELLEGKRISLHPSQRLVYVIDGMCPSLPEIRRVPAKGYKKPRWLPVCLRTVPYVATKERA